MAERAPTKLTGPARLYKTIYSRFGGRPWTHVIRAEYSSPIYWFVGGLAVGYVLSFDLGEILFLGGGVLLGHFWWGGDHRPNTKRR
jgi:hypothetical protein